MNHEDVPMEKIALVVEWAQERAKLAEAEAAPAVPARVAILQEQMEKAANLFSTGTRILAKSRGLLRSGINATMKASPIQRAAVGAGLNVARHYAFAPKDANGNRQGSAVGSALVGAAGGVAAPHLIKGVMNSDKIRGGIYGNRPNPFSGVPKAAPGAQKLLPGGPSNVIDASFRDVTNGG